MSEIMAFAQKKESTDEREKIKENIDQGKYFITKVISDTMEPTFSHGDLIFVDTTDKNYSGGGLFHFSGEGSNLTRLESWGKGKVTMSRENKLYPDKEFDATEFEPKIVGKVVAHLKIYY